MIAAVQYQHLGASDAIRQATQARKPQEIADICDEPPSPVREIAMRAGYRARLVVPLVSADKIVRAGDGFTVTVTLLVLDKDPSKASS